MLLRPLDLTTALRPSLLPDESLLFVQDAVGIYAGKAKLADYQNGQAYLTSHRACYVDNALPRERAVGVNLKDVERCELYAGFFKSSPKVTLIPKSARLGASALPGASSQMSAPSTRMQGSLSPGFSPSPSPQPLNATWVCPICSYSNPVPSNFDPASANANMPVPPCLACGIKPPVVHVIKAAVAGLSAQQQPLKSPGIEGTDTSSPAPPLPTSADGSTKKCPRCTFENHPSLHSCEICGASLAPNGSSALQVLQSERSGSASPAPAIIAGGAGGPESSEGVKFAFRAGGEKVFMERLKGALSQRKWLLESAPPLPTASPGPSVDSQSQSGPRNVGIAGLERRGLEMRKNNEVVIGNAFEDLAALMASAKEIIALAEQFSSQTQTDTDDTRLSSDPSQLLSQLNLTTTRDMLSSSGSASSSLYLTELSRSLAEFLTDDARGVLKSAGGVMSLVDLWAIFNRARGGVELVSPTDVSSACNMFETLSLPVRLRKFRKSGLLVVQEKSRTDERTIAAILAWLASLKTIAPADETPWDWKKYGRGVTILDAAEQFGWSVGVASEELEMAEESGSLCRESGLEGVRFWENWLVREVPDENVQL